MNKKIIQFKASQEESNDCEGYRKIIKRGNLEIDANELGDDAIVIFAGETNKINRINIDCDLKTGEFTLFIK